MVEPLIMAVAFFAALCVPVLIAAGGHRRPPRRHGRDYGAMADIEENDIGQMIEGLNERRRRRGEPEIGDELAERLRREARAHDR